MSTPSGRGPEPGMPSFGLTRQRTTRVEIVFTLKSGGTATVYHDTGEAVTAESIEAIGRELFERIAKPDEPATFADEWGASGQRAWVNLAEVAAFSLRPAR